MNNIAYLTNESEYSIFTFNDTSIKFLTSRNLDYYTKIVKWDEGYLVVEEINKVLGKQENYIDLIPILENLLIDKDTFLKDIREVKIMLSENKIKEIADEAVLIVKGYAFNNYQNNIRIINLNNPNGTMCIDKQGNLLESSMDEIEQKIVFDIWNTDKEFIV